MSEAGSLHWSNQFSSSFKNRAAMPVLIAMSGVSWIKVNRKGSRIMYLLNVILFLGALSSLLAHENLSTKSNKRKHIKY